MRFFSFLDASQGNCNNSENLLSLQELEPRMMLSSAEPMVIEGTDMADEITITYENLRSEGDTGSRFIDFLRITIRNEDGVRVETVSSPSRDSKFVVKVFGSGGNDKIVNNSRFNVIMNGGAGDDNLISRRGNDLMYGGGGDDRIAGNGGNDRINGGDGNDILSGRYGSDRIDGGDGSDKIFGGAGNDYLVGGNGDDMVWGGTGNDTLHSAQEFEMIRESANDFLGGGKGSDRFFVSDTTVVRAFGSQDEIERLRTSFNESNAIAFTTQVAPSKLYIVGTHSDDTVKIQDNSMGGVRVSIRTEFIVNVRRFDGEGPSQFTQTFFQRFNSGKQQIDQIVVKTLSGDDEIVNDSKVKESSRHSQR